MEALRCLARSFLSHNGVDQEKFALEAITLIALMGVNEKQMLDFAAAIVGVRGDGEG